MGWRIVKQPNGLFARFSEVVDNFTSLDMTREEAIAECRANGADLGTAELKVSRAERDDPGGFIEPSGKEDGLDRWRDCLETILFQHGDLALKEVLDLIYPSEKPRAV